MTMTSTAILHHTNCPDGWGSAWVAQQHLINPTIIPMGYDDPVPSIDGKVVWVLDFCFEPDQLVELCERAEAVRILDHHHTAAQHLEATSAPIEVFSSMWEMPEVAPLHWAILNQERSGVGLTMEWFDVEYNWLLNIEDRDLWRFELEHTADIFAAVTSRPYTIEHWDEIDRTPYGELVAEGRAINRYRQQLIENAVNDAWEVDIPGIGRVPITPCPYSVGSDVAGELAERSPLGVAGYFMVKEHSVRFGLRARNGGPNVADLAKELFGGGGHPGAAGFEVAREEFDAWC